MIYAKIFDWFLNLMIVVMIIVMYMDIKEIKHMVNEVICVQLELED